jgi:hypothetical protein
VSGQGRPGQRAHQAGHPDLLGPARPRRSILGHPRNLSDGTRPRAEEAQALGANGVPFFVIDRKYGIPGAQPAEVFLRALRTVYAEDRG